VQTFLENLELLNIIKLSKNGLGCLDTTCLSIVESIFTPYTGYHTVPSTTIEILKSTLCLDVTRGLKRFYRLLFYYHITCKTNVIKMLSRIVYACKYVLSDNGCLM